MRRSCTSEMDRVAGLAYCMGCAVLPLYDATAPLDEPWQLLIRSMADGARLRLFLLHRCDTPFGLFPSWAQFVAGAPTLEEEPVYAIPTADCLTLVQNDESPADRPGQYYQTAEISIPCHISVDGNKDLVIQFKGERAARRVPLGQGYTGIHGVILPGVFYTLVRLHLLRKSDSEPKHEEYWVVGEVVGQKKVVAAEGVRQSQVDVVKWAVILACANGIGWTMRSWDAKIVYVANEEALQRTKYRDQYMNAFETMRANGERSTTG
ncbi:hypothetical protein PsYK624_124350 [Phanerochaete sordida]|uniref:Uncharacterized protein n=1 Tax=Phanerochaete sordida TaxID=48140 RepID=A0A9P3GK38_9APHY|nr:hypothetical protein PsYK624_124350 [Phanerochaete sordida]